MQRANSDRYFFTALAIAISGTAFAGFWFTYFGPIIGRTYPPAGWALHIHGGSFFAWYLFFPSQAALIASNRRNLHMMLGRLSVALVVLMAATGILVLSVRVDEAMREGQPEVWLLYGPMILSNLILFVSFYAAAVRMAVTGRLQAHKRLIIVASAIGIGAGFFRLIFFLSGFHPLSIPIGVLACSLFILIGMIYDWLTRRSVHPAYTIGLVAMFLVEVSLLPQVNEAGVAWVNQWLAALGETISFLYNPEPTVEF
ncbi:MAG: hypothetical protein HKN35_09990 [Woeseia sp.]|nr:hypothetical protein [Woeseia sp.]